MQSSSPHGSSPAAASSASGLHTAHDNTVPPTSTLQDHAMGSLPSLSNTLYGQGMGSTWPGAFAAAGRHPVQQVDMQLMHQHFQRQDALIQQLQQTLAWQQQSMMATTLQHGARSTSAASATLSRPPASPSSSSPPPSPPPPSPSRAAPAARAQDSDHEESEPDDTEPRPAASRHDKLVQDLQDLSDLCDFSLVAKETEESILGGSAGQRDERTIWLLPPAKGIQTHFTRLSNTLPALGKGKPTKHNLSPLYEIAGAPFPHTAPPANTSLKEATAFSAKDDPTCKATMRDITDMESGALGMVTICSYSDWHGVGVQQLARQIEEITEEGEAEELSADEVRMVARLAKDIIKYSVTQGEALVDLRKHALSLATQGRLIRWDSWIATLNHRVPESERVRLRTASLLEPELFASEDITRAEATLTRGVRQEIDETYLKDRLKILGQSNRHHNNHQANRQPENKKQEGQRFRPYKRDNAKPRYRNKGGDRKPRGPGGNPSKRYQRDKPTNNNNTKRQ